eukprot:scaffold330394_cov53-Tisochrysis_lutea.AAC.3
MHVVLRLHVKGLQQLFTLGAACSRWSPRETQPAAPSPSSRQQQSALAHHPTTRRRAPTRAQERAAWPSESAWRAARVPNDWRGRRAAARECARRVRVAVHRTYQRALAANAPRYARRCARRVAQGAPVCWPR